MENGENGIYTPAVRFRCAMQLSTSAKIHGIMHSNFGIRLSKEPRTQKKQMRAAFNIAVYYETKDSLSQAVKWAEKAQQLAKKIEKKNVVNNVKSEY